MAAAPAVAETAGFLAPEEGFPAPGTLGTIGSGAVTWRNFLCLSSHPVASFFHIFFKSAAFVLYCFAEWFGLQYVTTFVTVVLLLSADFWTVKNVTGRLLVGLRWWSRTKDSGETEWLFESAPNSHLAPSLDKRIFWWALYAAPVVWAACGLAAFLTFSWDWLLVHAVATALTGSNLVGYTKCSGEASRRLSTSLAAAGAIQGALQLPAVQSALPALGSLLLGAATAVSGAGAAAAGAAAGAAAARRPAGNGAGAVPAPAAGVTDFEAVTDPFGTGAGAGGARAGRGATGGLETVAI